ncbi:beta-catenin-like protein 1 [Skeletonema marinoi]|uniref:Beta-catenin-like protein 1 n=1 Tax=Skeletonema marinoi TaxID=267567 RepID=A0AAD9DH88_9STRA|nr:beta-catenin-like protein 1 [Skeletonema marinoi]
MSNSAVGGGGGSVMDVLDRVIGLPGSITSALGAKSFIPSKKFSGSKPGYVFRSSDLGTGYYLDEQLQQHQQQDDDNRREKKRPRFEADDQNNEQRSVRFDASRDTTQLIPRSGRLTGSELLAQAEAQQSQQPTPIKTIHDLSSHGIQSSSASFLKTLTKNQLLRAQHMDNPEKFMMNELALNDEIQQFNSVAVNMRSYSYLVQYEVMEGWLTCLNHENSDVAMSVVTVLVELMDPLLLQEQESGGEEEEDEIEGVIMTPMERMDHMNALVTEFVKGGGLDLITSNLGRYDESVEEDAKGVEDVLTLVESLLDLDRAGVLQFDYSSSTTTEKEAGKEMNGSMKNMPSSIVSCICQQTTFLSWLFQRIEKSNDGDSDEATTIATDSSISPAVIKLHASEILSAILQHEDYSGQTNNGLCKLSSLPKYSSAFDDDDPDRKPAASSKEGENGTKQSTIDGMEILLLAIAAYRKQDPQVEVDCEFLENVFDALAASLLREDNVADFVDAEGIELMLRCLRQKVHAGGGALKVLNFALSGASSSANVNRTACETFVSAGGLKVIFPLYMSRKSAIPCPAACSEGGSNLAKKGGKNGSSSSKRAKRAAQARKRWLVEIERNSINVMYALTRHISQDSKYDAHARLLVKFVEEECEKCDRTIELCLKYDEKARIAEYQYFRSDAAEEAEQLGVDVELAALDAKLRGGGDLFHRTCAILSFACVFSKRCHGHVRDQLKMKGSGITVIKEGLTEFAALLADGHQKSQIERFIAEI